MHFLTSVALLFATSATAHPVPQFNWGELGNLFNIFGPHTSSASSVAPTTHAATTPTPAPTTTLTSVTYVSVTVTPTDSPTSTSSPAAAATSSSSSSFFGGGSDTRNDVQNNAPCKFITVIFARGTGESGNVGTAAGPPFFNALDSKFGGVAVQGVDYAASTSGFMGDDQGDQNMADMVNLAATQCPNTNIVVSGYSQGAMLVHRSAPSWSSAAQALIKAVVVFGDPMRSAAIQGVSSNNIDSICHSGDDVCEDGTFQITQAHLTYSQDAGSAADFVESKTGPAS